MPTARAIAYASRKYSNGTTDGGRKVIVSDFFNAFRAGSELAHAETWKKAQVLVNSLVALFTAALAISSAFGYKIDLGADGVQSIAAGIAALVGVFNGGITVATTTRIGLQPASGDSRSVGDDGVADRGIEGRGGLDSNVRGKVPDVVMKAKPPTQPDIFNNRSIG